MNGRQPAEDSDAQALPTKRSVFVKWAERGVWVFVLVLLTQRFGPQVGAALGFGGDLGVLPDFQVTTLDGEVISSEDLKGQVVLVNFWATWCGPCRVEMPGFQKVYDDHRDSGFVILGLSTDRDGASGVADFVEARGVRYPIAMSTPELEQAFGGIRGLPMSFLVDREGRIRNRVFGFFASPTLRLAVRNMLRSDLEAITD
ncbi:MAG: TlpA disulfide reductase family protein [Longimicrobiales bacterium]